MKYTVIISIAIIFSCTSPFRHATKISERAYIGMPINDFKSIAGRKSDLAAMEAGYTVFRINDYGVGTGIKDTKFYYFDSNGKLVKIDGGEFKQKRYQIELINK